MSPMAIEQLMLAPLPCADTAEDIAEMMAEAARVDALFQCGAISTIRFPHGKLEDVDLA